MAHIATLSETMDFDHVIYVDNDGNVSEPENVYAPDCVYQEVDSDGQTVSDALLGVEGWNALQGYTNQYGYNGCVLHSSEVIGGGLERDILARSGYYVAVVVGTSEALSDEENNDYVGWAVLYKEEIN